MTVKYNNGGIDAKAARNEVFKQPDGSKIIQIKSKAYTASINGQEFTVNYKLGSGLKAARCESGYDPEDSLPYILTREEAASREDPNSVSDAFLYATEELDIGKIQPLEEEECLDRYAWFVDICRRFSDDALLQFVLEQVPKKKNGTLHKGRVTIIAGLPLIMSEYLEFYVLAAKAKNDTELDISVLERPFSGELWGKTKDNVFLQYLASGKTPKNEKTYSVQLYSQPLYSSEKGYTFNVPAIKLEDGSFAIDALPYRALNSFVCLDGDDKNGYSINFPAEPEPMQIRSLGQLINVSFNFEPIYCGFNIFCSMFNEYMKYYKSRKKTDRGRAEYFVTGFYDRPIPDRALTEEYVRESVYQFLTTVDDVDAALKEQVFIQKAIDEAKRKKNGTLSLGGNSVTRVPIKSSIERQVPLVTAVLEMINRKEDSIEIRLAIIRDEENKWTS